MEVISLNTRCDRLPNDHSIVPFIVPALSELLESRNTYRPITCRSELHSSGLCTNRAIESRKQGRGHSLARSSQPSPVAQTKMGGGEVEWTCRQDKEAAT